MIIPALVLTLGLGEVSFSRGMEACGAKIERRAVRGNSLAGLIAEGRSVRISFGFYECRQVGRGDIVAYRYAGNAVPLIKVVKGLPGDEFRVRRSVNGWNILINGELIKNSKNEPYLIDEGGQRMLSLYVKDYRGIIPAQAYLIMGNLVGGTLDSSRFGLVHRNEILGKVLGS